MSKVCEFCGKHAVAGHSISHSHRVVNRTFKPNIQRVTVVVDGHRLEANVCSRCLKSGKIARSSRESPSHPRGRPSGLPLFVPPGAVRACKSDRHSCTLT